MAAEQTMPLEEAHPAEGHTLETSGIESRKLALWIFLASEVIFFSALIGTGILMRLQSPGGEWPAPGEVLNVPLTSLNTFILIVSSVTVVKGLEALQEGKQQAFRLFLVATAALGVTFLGVQAYEYAKLIEHGLTFTHYVDHHTGEMVRSTYGTAFYIQTGFHGAHVFGGVVWLLVVIGKAFAGVYTPKNYMGYEIFGLYWHFVDLVWILLFTIVYLI
jgi:heme/copper-type cytochrome/quinol oxidase subunit 3